MNVTCGQKELCRGQEGSEAGEGAMTAINEVTSDCFPVEVTYVNMMGMTSTTPFEGLNIVVTRYSNGSSLVTKEMR